MIQEMRIGCECIIKNDVGQILMGLRKNCFGAGTWGLPGGHAELGEKMSETAVREMKEELGIDIDVNDLLILCITDDIREDVQYLHITFEVTNFAGGIMLQEKDKCEEWKFFDIKNLPENIFFPHQKILDTLLSKQFYKTNLGAK